MKSIQGAAWVNQYCPSSAPTAVIRPWPWMIPPPTPNPRPWLMPLPTPKEPTRRLLPLPTPEDLSHALPKGATHLLPTGEIPPALKMPLKIPSAEEIFNNLAPKKSAHEYETAWKDFLSFLNSSHYSTSGNKCDPGKSIGML